VLLVFGSEAAVRGAIALSRASGLSPLFVGVVVIGTGTSMPELAVSMQAGVAGAPDIALGNVVGSNIINLLLILGLASLIRPMLSPPKVVLRDGGTMLAASALLALLAWGRVITRTEGAFLLVAFVAYVATVFLTDWRRPPEHSIACARATARLADETPSAAGGLLLVPFGLVALVLGAHFTVGEGVKLAETLHLSQAIVGLTVVALGTSLPELLLTMSAAARGETYLAIGQLIGSNIFNILGVIGATAVLHPLAVAPVLAAIDIPVMVAASALLLPLLASQWRLSRAQGALLLASYVGYLVFLAWRQGLLAPAMFGLS
jgi:cation:H+ antiporter